MASSVYFCVFPEDPGTIGGPPRRQDQQGALLGDILDLAEVHRPEGEPDERAQAGAQVDPLLARDPGDLPLHATNGEREGEDHGGYHAQAQEYLS